jgi:hypothetical protein
MEAPEPSMPRSGDGRAAVIAVGVLVIAAGVVLLGSRWLGDRWFETYDPTPVVECDQIPPLAETWRGAGDMLRRRVAAYVVDCGALRGRSRAEVRVMFGRPVEGDRHELWFHLGPDNLSIDSENLVILFGRDGRVMGAEVAQG